MSADEKTSGPAAAHGESGDEMPPPAPRDDELVAVAEALLFAATSPLSLERLSQLMGGTPPELVEAAVGDLRARYENRRSGLAVMPVAGGWQMATRPEVADWVLALHKHRRRNPISPALLETLAIVAYKQPIARAEIEAIRGVDCSGVMRALMDAGLVDVVGHKEVPGRPSLYGTSDNFLRVFGLRGLDELPTLGELKAALDHAPAPEAAADVVTVVEDASSGAPAPSAAEPEETIQT